MPESEPPTPKRADGGRSERSKPSIFWLLAALIVPIMNLAARYVIIDGAKFPKSGALVLAPNHFSEIDPVVIGVVSWKRGRLPRFLAKASVFKIPIAGWLLRRSGQIPVERSGNSSNSALSAAEELVAKGRMVVVYPEGSLTRDPDLWPMRGKSGAVRIALEHGIPVIPVAHWGTQELMARYAKKISFFPRKTIYVKFGDPVDLDEFRGLPLTSATLTAATARVMQSITLLLSDLRGEPAPVKPWNPNDHDQKETGRFEG